MRKKKWMVSIACICLFLACSWSVYGKEKMNTGENEGWVNVSSITDPDELQEIIENENLSIPEGYHLESIDTYIYTLEAEESLAFQTGEIEPLGIIYNIENVRNRGDGFYYTNEYDSDWFYGPANVSETYTRTNSVKKSINVGVTNNVVSTAVGYDITDTFTNTKTFSTNVASGKKVNVKVHTNYQKKTFDIYNKITGDCAQSGAYTMKPVGLIFKQYTYAQ